MSDDRQEKVTQPMVEVLLDRLQSLETRFEARLMQTSDDTATRIDATAARLEQLIDGLRSEMNTNFVRVLDEISILNDDVLKTRAGQRELRRRVEVLESKVS
jgi:hypothetical protein